MHPSITQSLWEFVGVRDWNTSSTVFSSQSCLKVGEERTKMRIKSVSRVPVVCLVSEQYEHICFEQCPQEINSPLPGHPSNPYLPDQPWFSTLDSAWFSHAGSFYRTFQLVVCPSLMLPYIYWPCFSCATKHIKFNCLDYLPCETVRNLRSGIIYFSFLRL